MSSDCYIFMSGHRINTKPYNSINGIQKYSSTQKKRKTMCPDELGLLYSRNTSAECNEIEV